jgi:hypothetical protein
MQRSAPHKTNAAPLSQGRRERVPLDWAMTQMNLGTALFRLGERESGTAKLEEAVAAYRDALKERTRAREPRSHMGRGAVTDHG